MRLPSIPGPGELAAFHPESYTVLEGYGTQCRKSDFYDLLLPDFSLVFTREKRVHDARRNVWSRELSTQGKCYESDYWRMAFC